MGIPEIISIIAAIVTAPFSSWLTAKLLRNKYDAEVEGLRAQVEASKADTRGDELENVKNGMSILMEQVVEPLKKRLMRYVRNWPTRRAVEKVNNCPHVAACPVRIELQRAEECEPRSREPTR